MMAMNPGVSRRARWWFIAGVAMVVLSAPAIYGCGPWFDEAVFIPGGAPQTSQSEFASGKLGIVLPSMRRSYLIVAYRYLNGMKLTMSLSCDFAPPRRTKRENDLTVVIATHLSSLFTSLPATQRQSFQTHRPAQWAPTIHPASRIEIPQTFFTN